MYGVNPLSHAFLLSLYIHYPGTAAISQQGEDVAGIGCLAQLGHFFARGYMMGADQSIEERHSPWWIRQLLGKIIVVDGNRL